MTTTVTDQWTWITSKGHSVDVRDAGYFDPASLSDEDAEFYEPWFAEGPGQREPRYYDLVNLTTGESVRLCTGVVYEPWTYFDAISDKLKAWGWTDTTLEEPGTCEHGLSAALCAGPEHYPMDH